MKVSCISYSWKPEKFWKETNNYSIPELGHGWSVAILETERELLFIREAQKTFSDVRSFWVGGFTDLDPDSTVPYSDYYPLGSGNESLIVLIS